MYACQWSHCPQRKKSSMRMDLFILSCGMQFPRCDAIIKHDVIIRSTFCALTAGVQYRSLWQIRSRSKHASSSSVPYFVFKLGKKVSVKLDFKLGMELKKVQKQGRDERTQEDYRTSAKIHSRCRVVFLRSFISTFCFCTFSAPSLT